MFGRRERVHLHEGPAEGDASVRALGPGSEAAPELRRDIRQIGREAMLRLVKVERGEGCFDVGLARRAWRFPVEEVYERERRGGLGLALEGAREAGGRELAADPVVGERDVRDVRRPADLHVAAHTVAGHRYGDGLGARPLADGFVSAWPFPPGTRAPAVATLADEVEGVGVEFGRRLVRVVARRTRHRALFEARAEGEPEAVRGDPEVVRVSDLVEPGEDAPVGRDGLARAETSSGPRRAGRP